MADDDSAEQRKRVIAEAKAHLDGTWTPERFPREPIGSPHVEKSGLVYRTQENAQQPRASDDAWNAWLDARLAEERQLLIEVIGEVVAKLRSERAGEQSAETAAEFAKIWKAIVETKKMLVDIQRERVTQGFREVGGDPAKKMN